MLNRAIWMVLAAALAGGCGSTGKQALEAPGFGPYSSAVLTDDLCFVSGKIGDRDGTFAHEVETAIDGVEAELARAGLTLADVVTATVFLTDMGRYAEVNEIYGARFPKPYPARACVAVKELPVGAQVEIQVIAAR